MACLFFLFKADNREFLWREKEGFNENGYCREILFSNKSRVVARFFSQNREVGGIVDFGGGDQREELSSEQAKVWFEMQKFSRSAKPGDIYRTDYKTAKNDYKICIEALGFSAIQTASGRIVTLYFEGQVLKKNERFTDLKFWIASEGKLKGQVIKCIFKKSFWPSVVIEIM